MPRGLSRDFPTVLSVPLIFVYIGLFGRLLGWRWETIALAGVMALFTDFALGFLFENKWEIAGVWPWVYTVVAHCWGDGKFWYLTLRNPVSLPRQMTLDLLNQFEFDLNELKRSMEGQPPREYLEVSKPSFSMATNGGVPIPPPDTAPDPGGSSQVLLTGQVEKPFEPDVETLVGVNPRKRTRHFALVCVKADSSPLAGQDHVGHARHRQTMRSRRHVASLMTKNLGIHYLPGHGSYRLFIGFIGFVGPLPAYITTWLHRTAEQAVSLQAHISDLHIELQKLKSKADLVKTYKETLDDFKKENTDLHRMVEAKERALARANLPTANEWAESWRPPKPPKKGIARNDLLKIAAVIVDGLASYAIYNVMVTTADFAMLAPYAMLIAPLIFVSILYIAWRRLR